MENETCKIIKTNLSNKEVVNLLGREPGKEISILPESSDSRTLLNEYAPDMKKLATNEKIPCEVIYNDDYEFLELRSADIILPFIISLSASLCCELFIVFIKRFFSQSTSTLRVRMISKKEKEDGSEYEKTEISGSANEVVKALEIIKKENESTTNGVENEKMKNKDNTTGEE